jgi:predicted MFS family arabinose efflux permease
MGVIPSLNSMEFAMNTPRSSSISSGMVMLLAAAAGIIVANLYYAQPLVGPIGAALGLPPAAAGLIVTLTQIGYTLGLLFIVPLGDLVENRRLIVAGLLVTSAALLVAATATTAWAFLLAALTIGLGAVVAQVLVPFAAHLAPEATRGQIVGKVVSGLLLGIMVARPVASVLAGLGGWHTVFVRLCRRWLATTVVLRQRALYHAGLFGAFSLFWTVAPQALAGPAFGLTQNGIALFALVGMAGAVASPVAGRLADAGHTLKATAVALVVGALSFLLPMVAPSSKPVALGLLAVAAIALDAAVAANLVLGQRALFALGADMRSRLNGLYFALFFAGGAVGSALGGWVYAAHGWHAALLVGMLLPALALLVWVHEATRHAAARQSA